MRPVSRQRLLGMASAQLAAIAMAGCTLSHRAPVRYIDLKFPVAGSAGQYAHTVDAAGALWFIDGDAIVRETGPSQRRIAHHPRIRSGSLFWYEGAVYAVDGDGRNMERFDKRLRAHAVPIPVRYAPVDGAVADARYRWVVLARPISHELAVLDVWKWYAERVPESIAPFAAALAGGPHGKKYLVVGDQRRPLVSIENRWYRGVRVVRVPDNVCFSNSGAGWHVPVDARGRDADRTWVTTGEHVASIELSTKRILRVWDAGGCAVHIVAANGDSATVVVASRDGDKYVSSLKRFDRAGVHSMPQYGRIAGVAGAALMDRYRRLWWFDPKAHAFICRTPLS
ncbi:MAG TPA: hypothetical protein VNG31_01620 [Candidatus Baltobacteraceae bacterium]|nr:hypothetical protein [Candidatus Baltobacteraceae bacterium]